MGKCLFIVICLLIIPISGYAGCPYDYNCLDNPYGAGSPYKSDGLMNPYSMEVHIATSHGQIHMLLMPRKCMTVMGIIVVN